MEETIEVEETSTKEDNGEISIDNFTYKFYGKYLLLEYEDYFDDGYVKVTEQFIIDIRQTMSAKAFNKSNSKSCGIMTD